MRLIDADALLKALKTLSFPIELDSNVMTMFTHDVVNAITNSPTIQREGWVSVPIEPTREMLEAAKVAVNDLRELAGDCNCNDDYAKRLEEAIKSYEVK